MVLAAALPLSHFLMGLATFVLFLNWLAEWNWKEKWQRICQEKVGFVFGALYLFLFLGLIRTDNWHAASHELLAQLPLIFMPVLLVTSRPLSANSTRFVIHSFIFSTLFCCVCGWIYFFKNNLTELREMSLFVDHIRFSLCTVLAFVLSASYMIHSNSADNLRVLYGMLALLFFVYVLFSHTLTGIVCLLVIIFCYCLYHIIAAPKRQKWQSATALVLLFLFSIYVAWITVLFFKDQDKVITTTVTEAGNPYTFDANTPVENGHRIGYYICREELQKAWTLRSDSALTESREQVLIRYLNSRGLHKDYAALMSLKHKDIKNIEQGVSNYIYLHTIDFRSVLYPTYFSLSLYHHSNYIANSSLLERVELWKASLNILREQPLLGVGVGDQKDVVDAQLERQHSSIAEKKQRGSHNQYLTFALMGGVFMVLYFFYMMLYPFVRMRHKIHFVYVAFVLMMLMSMLIEDTLETQTGRMLFSMMMPLLLLYWPEKDNPIKG